MIILLKFAPLHDNADIDKLSSHLRSSSFCFFATQMIGGAEEYDYACSLLCDTKQQFNSQLELILNTFRINQPRRSQDIGFTKRTGG